MKEIQQLRRIAVKLGVSGTVMPLAETKLYKGGYGFVVLQAYVPIMQNRSPDTSPLCTIFRTTVDKFGNRKQLNNDLYNMLHTIDAEIENAKYIVFECPLHKSFTDAASCPIGICFQSLIRNNITNNTVIKPNIDNPKFTQHHTMLFLIRATTAGRIPFTSMIFSAVTSLNVE